MEQAAGTDAGAHEWADQDQQDEATIASVIRGNNAQIVLSDGKQLDFAEFHGFQIDQTDKLDEAIDFEDISDDDLASEEEGPSAAAGAGADSGDDADVDNGDNGITQFLGFAEDDGPVAKQDDDGSVAEQDDDGPVARQDDDGPAAEQDDGGPVAVQDDDDIDDEDIFGDRQLGLLVPSPSPEAEQDPVPAAPVAPRAPARRRTDEVTDEEWNRMSIQERIEINFPEPEVHTIGDWISEQTGHLGRSARKKGRTLEELYEKRLPRANPYKVLAFTELFPAWPAPYPLKEPPKSPPPLLPTKLELDIEPDTAKLIRVSGNGQATSHLKSQQSGEESEWARPEDAARWTAALEDPMSESDDDGELVGGYTLDEIAVVCDDWNEVVHRSPPQKTSDADESRDIVAFIEESFGTTQAETVKAREKKKRKFEPYLPDISSFDAGGIGNFVEATKRSASVIQFDLNDPYLLVDDVLSARPAKRPRHEAQLKRMANGQMGKDIHARYNISNDEEYNALKTNSKNKVRAMLSNLAVEHSMPAQRLTFPFYRTKLQGDFWQHHRTKFDVDRVVRSTINLKKPTKVKRGARKGKSLQQIFQTTKDLSLNDNSTAVLFEYCEQSPTVLSNFGMGNRIINYYRRPDGQSEDRPEKTDIGETHVLLPEDKSPFSIFGTVEAGETVPTFHNEMYRAPIFKHEPRRTDFLFGSSTNAQDGAKYFLRAIDHLYVVGQTFPSMEVPGPHARKIGNTLKLRLRMVTYRLMRRNGKGEVHIDEVWPHCFQERDAQNRQKMKEFLKYDKESKMYSLKDGEPLPDEVAIRAFIKPEDVCLMEAMQVGQAQLDSVGYDAKTWKEASGADEDDDPGSSRPLVAKLVPWETTKNFIDASAGKAMVALHGDGDPTGHGLGFSFIKTSMKGGYINAVQGPGATSADAIERERKANGGHTYNVKKQEFMYKDAIAKIWARQKETLSDPTTHQDSDVAKTSINEDDRWDPETQAPPHRPPPSHVDDGRSQLSRLSTGGRGRKRKLVVTRQFMDGDGVRTEEVTIENPHLQKAYKKLRTDAEAASQDVYKLKPTGDATTDRVLKKYVDTELSRLVRNSERRDQREKSKKRKNADPVEAASPDVNDTSSKATTGTSRKCANCGQVGHIKTNKSKCPLLNGTLATSGAPEHGGFGSFGAPSFGGPADDAMHM